MKILLDTCCIIWAASDPKKLTPAAISALESDDAEVYVSAISCAEVACLAERTRIALDRHWKVWFNAVIDTNQWSVIDIGLDIVQEAYSLPDPFHRDPADRLITATARLRGLSVVTADEKILSYPHVPSVW
jgi:PIN domain nuclease of toxin-antitoxin system